nr:tetratricopeptide repeat protein [candidate division Zixibacteria bacterium]
MVLISIFLAVTTILLIGGGCGRSEDEARRLKQEGNLALQSGDTDRALKLFKEGLEIRSSDRDFLFNIGICFKRLDILDSALVYFRHTRILYPRDPEVNRELIHLCPIYGDYDCAINAIAMLVSMGDNEQLYWSRLAELYYRKNEYGMAVKYYKLILADNPDDWNAYLSLSTTLAQMGKTEESNDFLQAHIDRFGPSAEAYTNMAVNFITLKNIQQAEQCFRKSLALNPEKIPVWINLANVLSEQKDMAKKREALEIYKKYRQQTPKFYNLDSLIPALEQEISQ